jgi:quercetin dioxygenase-like cupin family protein
MTIIDRVGQQQEIEGLLEGKGECLLYVFFREENAPTMFFGDMAFEPGAYAGYHRHEMHDTILYVLSGTAEHYQEGERRTLKPGDAVLIKSGHPHACRNIGDEDLKIIEFAAILAGERPPGPGGMPLPLPADIADWE